MIPVQLPKLRANWALAMGPLGVSLAGKGEKGWKWGKEKTVVQTGVTLLFCEKCPRRVSCD
jgi:hypothetical protein